MRPKTTFDGEYEKVTTDDWTTGIIEKVDYDENHEFPVFTKQGDKYVKSGVKTAEAVRFRFKLDGYEKPHVSRWMTFNYGEKANLVKKYLMPLLGEMKADFDIESMNGMPVKVMWAEKNGFYSVDVIRPIKVAETAVSEPAEGDPVNESDEAPGRFQDGEEEPF